MQAFKERVYLFLVGLCMCVANSSWQTEKEAEEPHEVNPGAPNHHTTYYSSLRHMDGILTFWTRQGLNSLQQRHLQAPHFTPHLITLTFAHRDSLTLSYLCTHIT